MSDAWRIPPRLQLLNPRQPPFKQQNTSFPGQQQAADHSIATARISQAVTRAAQNGGVQQRAAPRTWARRAGTRCSAKIRMGEIGTRTLAQESDRAIIARRLVV